MRSQFVGGVKLEDLLDPEGSAWKGAKTEAVSLMGTPVGLQPTGAIRAAWTGKKIGVVERVSVASQHDGQLLAFRLEWGDASENRELEDTTAFPDGAAVLLPAVSGAPMMTMGAPGKAVNAWYWRADETTGHQLMAEGLGTSRTVDTEQVRVRGVWKGGRWRVVIARALQVESGEPLVQIRPGESTAFGVAIWEGSQGERAGIKAFSGDWRELHLDALPTARR